MRPISTMMSPCSKRLTMPFMHFADALVELGEDVLALGLAHLLEDHLLGGLRGDAARGRRCAWGTRSGSRPRRRRPRRTSPCASASEISSGRVGHLVDDRLDREQLDLAVLGVELGLQLLAGLVVLARGGEHGLFHRGDDDVGLDALFLGQCLDGLHQRIGRHGRSELHIEAGPADQPERQPVHRLPPSDSNSTSSPSTPAAVPRTPSAGSPARPSRSWPAVPANRR